MGHTPSREAGTCPFPPSNTTAGPYEHLCTPRFLSEPAAPALAPLSRHAHARVVRAAAEAGGGGDLEAKGADVRNVHQILLDG